MKTNVTSKLQIAAILLLFAGWGWSGGNFTPSDAPFINPLLHCIPLLLLMVFSLPILHIREGAESNMKWAIAGISVLTILGIIGTTALVILGATNPDPGAIGVKTLEDWFPTVMMYTGNFLWLGTLLFSHQRHPARRGVANN